MVRKGLYSIARLFKREVPDEEFVECLNWVLKQIIPAFRILERAGLLNSSRQSEYEQHVLIAKMVMTYRTYLIAAQVPHNVLVDIKPRKEHGQIHEAALATSASYMETIWAYSVYSEVLNVDRDVFDVRRLDKARRDVQEWDLLAYRELLRFNALVKHSPLDIQIPDDLEEIANADAEYVGHHGGLFVTVR